MTILNDRRTTLISPELFSILYCIYIIGKNGVGMNLWTVRVAIVAHRLEILVAINSRVGTFPGSPPSCFFFLSLFPTPFIACFLVDSHKNGLRWSNPYHRSPERRFVLTSPRLLDEPLAHYSLSVQGPMPLKEKVKSSPISMPVLQSSPRLRARWVRMEGICSLWTRTGGRRLPMMEPQ